MLEIKENIDLRPYTTLKIGSLADYFAVLKEEQDLFEAIDFARDNSLNILILGGGSNLLISQPVKALVLKNEIKGIKKIKEDDERVWLQGQSGELWSAFVYFAIEQGWGGVENLFYVPGTVGAAPIQNIGAYGVELKDTFFELEAIDLKTKERKVFNVNDCEFGYRQSVFKGKYRNRYFVLSVTLRLSKRPQLKLDYGDIKTSLLAKGIEQPSLQELAQTIKEIRDSKLPNPTILPNAGSFFKNPEILEADFIKLQATYPEIKFFPGSKEGLIKIPAGWLIERAGFKGKRFGDLAMYEKQALILVNYGSASAAEALEHIKRVQTGVQEKFAINLEPEVNII
ncbi:MAG: UDP-N-acetylmuramate dehydrogenase [Patescibacteria group bacterium]|jgi:UDP-N-acetylmuramate dehydrogenase|nr:UDP-N-acetylmuramate dehydrogenase [Patescibacteria group bacterium]